MKRVAGLKDQEYFRKLDEICLANKRQRTMTFVIVILLSISLGPSVLGFNFGGYYNLITIITTVAAGAYFLLLVAETPKVRPVPRQTREDVEPIASSVSSPMIPNKKVQPELSPFHSPKASINNSSQPVMPVTPSLTPARHSSSFAAATTPVSRHYDISPMLQPSNEIRSSGKRVESGPVTLDALQALRLVSWPAPWLDSLQLLLGNHLHRLVNQFDAALAEFDRLLTQATTIPPTQGGITANDLAKAKAMLALTGDKKKDSLDNGNTITLPDIYRYLQRLGVGSNTVIVHSLMVDFVAIANHLYGLQQHALQQHLTWATLPLHAPASLSATPSATSASATAATAATAKLPVMALLQRLRTLVDESDDHRLRLRPAAYSALDGGYSATAGAGGGAAVPLSDSELAMALFLHLCDLQEHPPGLLTTKPLAYAQRFSALHCAYSVADVDSILHRLPASASASAAAAAVGPGFAARPDSSPERASTLTVLFATAQGRTLDTRTTNHTLFPAQYKLSPGPAASLYGGLAGAAAGALMVGCHYDVHTFKLSSALAEEASHHLLHRRRAQHAQYTLDSNVRQNAFESILLFLLLIFLRTPEEVLGYHGIGEAGMGGSGSGGERDYLVVRDLLHQVVSKDDLAILYGQYHGRALARSF